MPWTWCNNSLKPGVIKTEYQRGLQPWFHETFRQKFQGLRMMKEGKLENGLLGSTALIVQKSHQINTESHLQPFFSWAFQNGLSNENSEITKAPIRLYAHPFSSFPLKVIECASLHSHLSPQVVLGNFIKMYISTHTIEKKKENVFFSVYIFYTIFHSITQLLIILRICTRNYAAAWFDNAGRTIQVIYWKPLREFPHGWRASIARALSGSPHPSLLSQCLFKEVQGVHEL